MTMSEKQLKRLIVLSTCLGVTLIVANLSALKIWKLGSLPVDAGILMFPLSYVAGDLLAEFYGEKLADFVALIAAIFGVITLVMLYLANCLPNYPGADNSGFDAVASLAGQVFLASIISFLLGQCANNSLFDRIRYKRQKSAPVQASKIADKTFFVAFAERALISSSVAHLVDAVVFEVIAFYGKLPPAEFIEQIVFAYVAGLLLELLLFPITYVLAKRGQLAS